MLPLIRISAFVILYSLHIDTIVLSAISVTPVRVTIMPPFSFLLMRMSGGSLLSRIPKPSSSCSITRRCPSGLVASRTIRIVLQVLLTAMTWRPRPLPSLAPSIIPGRSSTWILEPA